MCSSTKSLWNADLPVEIGNLTLNDIDLEKGLISVYSAAWKSESFEA